MVHRPLKSILLTLVLIAKSYGISNRFLTPGPRSRSNRLLRGGQSNLQAIFSSETGCSKHCLSCTQNHQCRLCYKRHITSDGFRCLEEEAPGSEHCLIYYQSGSSHRCFWCEKGYSFDVYKNKCVRGQLKNCYREIYGFHRTAECQACGEGEPTERGKRVVCAGNAKKFENCLWMGRDPWTGAYTCERCRQGFTSLDGLCVKSQIEGCWICYKDGSGAHRCEICDALSGWSDVKGDRKSCNHT